jgi:hypothetical protein
MNKGIAAPDPNEPRVPMNIITTSCPSANLNKESDEYS